MEENKKIPALLSVKEAASYLGMADWTMRDYFRDGIIKAYKINGKTWRTTRKDLDDFIAQSTHNPSKKHEE